ncbi:MAG: FecR domain-containing protein [Betaproteobacteria bacterium]|nr:FecR domain-containing protein [Betaproteobacteria bacterium]
MNAHDAIPNTARRANLQRLAALGLLGPAGISGLIQEALAAGDMPAIPGINRIEGTATVNGAPAKVGTPVKPGDTVATGKVSMAVVVISGDAFLLRESSTITFKGKGDILDEVIVAAGKLLSVFSKRRTASLKVATRSATIGIRGTGMYLESVEKNRDYFCLCYGEAVVEGKGMSPQTLKTTHHEAPVWLDQGGNAMKLEPGPFLNHTDAELIVLESLVGRKPPFWNPNYDPRTTRY